MQQLMDLINEYKDDRRHPLIADSKDWELITPALVECVAAIHMGITTSTDVSPIVRVFAETIYVMGHERGKLEAEKPMPTFVVASES